jgi:hypothetical protein
MASIMQKRIEADQEFLRRYRLAYLRSIGAEIGITDLRDVALREARAMIEAVEDFSSAELRASTMK